MSQKRTIPLDGAFSIEPIHFTKWSRNLFSCFSGRALLRLSTVKSAENNKNKNSDKWQQLLFNVTKKTCKFQFSVEIKYFDRVSFFSLHSSRASNTIPNRRAKAYKQRDGKKRLLSNIYIFRIHTLNSQNLIKIGIGMLRYLNLTAICTSCKAKSRKPKYLMLKIESSSEFSRLWMAMAPS